MQFVRVEPVGAGGIVNGAKATATTAAAISATSVPCARGVVIQNLDASINVYVGGSTLTISGATRGPIIAAGKAITLPPCDLKDVYVASASGTPDIAWMGM